MPIPRYEGGSTPFQQVDPTAAKASAQMFSSLSQRLDSWGDTLYEQAKVEVAQKGQEQAIKDMTSGDELRTEKGYGFYAKAYNDISKAAYNIQVESDLKKFAEEAQAKDPLNYQKFDEVFKGYTKGALGKIEDPNFKAIYMQQAWKIGATAKNAMVKASYENARKNSIDVIKMGIKDQESEYQAAFANGDQEGMAQSLAKYTASMENLSLVGEMSKDAIPFKIKELNKEAIFTTRIKELETAVLDKKSGYIINYLKSDEYKALAPDDKSSIRKRMYEHEKGLHDTMTQEFKGNYETVQAMSKVKFDDLSNKIVQGVPIKETDLDLMLDNREITYSDHKVLSELLSESKAGAITSDANKVLKYRANINTVSKAVILSDRDISFKDKITLINHKDANENARTKLQINQDDKKMYMLKYDSNPHVRLEQLLRTSLPATSPQNRKKSMQAQQSIIDQVDDEIAKQQLDPLRAYERGEELLQIKLDKDKAKREEEDEKAFQKVVDKELTKRSSGVFNSMKSWAGEQPASREQVEKELRQKKGK